MSNVNEILKREQVLAALRGALEPRPWAHSMWEAGAAALGRVDEWSDIDLQVIVDDDRVDEAFELVEDALTGLSPIALRFRLPEPTWHGHGQAFYRLRDASEYLLVDLVIMKLASEQRFLEPERHGQAAVVFDKAGLVRPAPLDEDAWRARLRRRVETLRVTFPMFQSLVKKELYRGNDVEALAFYHSSTLRPLVEILRIRHVPFQHDYHTRYVQYDLPPEVHDRLRDLFFVTDLEDLANKRASAEAWFDETLARLDLDD